PSLWLHPSQGVAVGDTVILHCNLPRLSAWVQLWFNGTLRSDKEKDEEQDTVEFSLVVTNLEDAGTYQCRYQVSEPLWTSNMSDPVELVVTGAKGPSHGNRVVVVVRGCAAVFVFCLGLYFVLDARSLWTQRDESPGVPPAMTEDLQIQVPPSDSEDLTYTEMQDATPCSQPSTSHTALQSPVINTKQQWHWPSSWVSDNGDVVPRGLVALSGTRTVSLAGWCLVAANRAQQLPRPSLWLHYSKGVSLGDTVTLQCHLPRLAARVWLYHVGGSTLNKYKDKVQDVVEFTFVNTSREHAGRYQCQYRVPESEEISEKSDPVELVVTGEGTGDRKWLWGLPTEPCPNAVPSPHADHGFPPPGISLQGKERVGTGTNVTIHCWNKDYGAAFLLHKDGRSAPIQRQDPDAGGTATFTLLGVTPADAGTYRCSYHPKDYPFVSSRLGSSVTLEVTPTAATPDPAGSEEWSRASLVIALLRVLVAALVFGVGVFFVIDGRSLWIQRDESCGTPVIMSI
ncbi:immunoglobulin superfamily member 1-like, partial [Numida meleagris]|uniref:immunoglobulin superfamily member 1-like n=1 Tax=Numida meleagris TaxID=8996 RepID=UPI000B3E3F9A